MNRTQDKVLYLLDAMALIYRAYFAFNKNPRLSSKGMNTSAIFGFTNVLWDVIKNEKPTHIGVAFDLSGPTLRSAEFETYKANRQATPEDIVISVPYIKRLLNAFKIPVLESQGYEADDIIGTLARKAESEGFTTYIMSSDKDMAQLVTGKIMLYRPGKFGNEAEKWGIREVCERFSVENPLQVIDLLGLWGDSSDNIPGVPGVGEKTAVELLKKFGSIENLIENASQIERASLREKIMNNTTMALDSKRLATILLDAPVEFNENDLLIKDPDELSLKALFDELEFRTVAKRIFTDLSLRKQSSVFDMPSQGQMEEPEISLEIRTLENTTHHYHVADTPEKRKALTDEIRKSGTVCFDTETTGIDPNLSELVGLSFSWKPHEAWYVPIPDNYHEAYTIVNEFKEILEDEKISKTGQNLKFDIMILKWYDIRIAGTLFDTMLAHYLIEPEMKHGMDFMAEHYLKYRPVSIETLIGKKGKDQMSMRMVPLDIIKEYAAEDADITLQLRHVFEPMLKTSGAQQLADEIEMPLIQALASMETEGVSIDIEALREFSGTLQTEILKEETEIFELAGERFNIASPKQLGVILFEKLRISDNPKTTQTKQYSTSEDVLLKLQHKHPIIDRILEYRSLTKLKSTYVDSLPLMVNPRTRRVHTSYNQAVTSTGRLSSNNPNLQNIPVRTERGREIRKAFVPRNPDYLLLAADYSQIELRIIASISGDPGMIEDFNLGHDIHAATAAKVYGIPMEEVSREMRRNAKTVNFGIVYGISAFGLSERLNIPRGEAANIINQYFKQYPGIRQYMDQTIKFAKVNGYVETLMGRRRYLRDINSANQTIRGFAERNAINAPIQGSAADMIKIAMVRIHHEFEKQNLTSKMIMQVHDELVFDVYQPEMEVVKEIVRRNMTEAMPLKVPVVVDMNEGKNWLEAH